MKAQTKRCLLESLIVFICVLGFVGSVAALIVGYSGPGGGGTPSSYDAFYDFEEAGIPATGWSTSDTIDWDTYPPEMQGNECVQINPTDEIDWTFFAETDTRYFTMMFRVNEQTENNETFLSIRSASNVVLGYVYLRASNTWGVTASGGSLGYGGSWTVDTNQYIRVMYTNNGGGGSSTLSLWTWDGTWNLACTSAGTSTAQPAKVRFSNNCDTEILFIDVCKEDDAELTDPY